MGPTIDFQALIQGKRLQACSDKARLLFPYLFMGSNSLGRLELDIDVITDNILIGFKVPLVAEELWAIIQEYRTHHLMFVYRAGERLWGQWFVKEGYLPKYVTKRDAIAPAPPEESFKKWLDSYKNRTISEKPAFFQEVPESQGNFQPREEKSGVEKSGVEKRSKPTTPPTPSGEGKRKRAAKLAEQKKPFLEEFERVWKACWSSRGKLDAQEAYVQARMKGVSYEKIITAVQDQAPGILAESDKRQGTPVYLATWINKGRYDDDPQLQLANGSRASPIATDEDWSCLDEEPEGVRKHHG